MKKIKILTDSGADLSPEYLKKHPELFVLKSSVLFNKVDISNGYIKEFYGMLECSDILPEVKHLSSSDFLNYFQENSDYEILYISMSKNLSNNFQAAEFAKRILAKQNQGDNIHIWNSGTASIKQSVLVNEAYKCLIKGYSVLDIINHLNKINDDIVYYYVIEDLDYLRRIGKVDNWTAKMNYTFYICPIITIDKDEVVVVKKLMGRKNIIKFLKENMPNEKTNDVFLANSKYCNTYPLFEAEMLCPFNKVSIGHVMSTYFGPYCYGYAYVKNKE